ncbi:hypothetical protein C9374_008567 [Naegleria lovaniensis]|uniref:Ankyrin repeat domain-containing protein n=1 Tax=Naegleria lovaniensis TaxID=51637 RepID=A0AA88GJH8_NAELO|nr:uncharacterized protein C9374_008567 [Naegleria lovaniensis]KAG2377945.1 hypothetical protein C9374_008567 [Naegleria lovaniensis]
MLSTTTSRHQPTSGEKPPPSSTEKIILKLDDSDDDASSIDFGSASCTRSSFISVVFSDEIGKNDDHLEKQPHHNEEIGKAHHLQVHHNQQQQPLTLSQSPTTPTAATGSLEEPTTPLFLSTSHLSKTSSQIASSPMSLSMSGNGNGPYRRVSKTLVSLSKCLLGDNSLKVGSHIAERSSAPCFETGSSTFTDCSLPPDLYEAVTPRTPNSSSQTTTNSNTLENASTSPLLSSSGNIDGKELIDRLTQMIKNNELKTKSSNPPISFSCDYCSNPSSPTHSERNSRPSSPSHQSKCQNSPTHSLHSYDSFGSNNGKLTRNNETCPEEFFGPHVVECVLNEMLWPQYSFCTLCHLAARFNSVEVLSWLKDCCCDENCRTDVTDHPTTPNFEASPNTSISTTHSPTTNHNDVRIQIDSASPPRLSLAVNIDMNSMTIPTTTEFHDAITCASAKASFSSQTSLLSDEINSFTCSTSHPQVSIQFPAEQDQTSHTLHSHDCINRQKNLWTTLDSISASPLLYAVQYGAHEACVFLCSQPAVQSQINFTRDRFGNLPIVLALKKKDFVLCDLLQLFGAKFDMIGSVALGESLLHTALRELDIVTSEYLVKKNPKIILKKNQRDEIALFRALRDFRPTGINKQMTVSIPGNPNSPPKKTLVKTNIVRDSNTLGNHAVTLREFLEKGPEWLGEDLLEKAITCKNSFGRNILLESVAINDIDSTKVLCGYISRKLDTCVGRTKKQFEEMVFDPEKINTMNIIQLAIQSSLQVSTHRSEETFFVFNGFCWLLDWLRKTFSVSCPHSLAQLLSSRDSKGRTAIEIAAKESETNSSFKMFHQLLFETESTWKSLVPATAKLENSPSIKINSPSKKGGSASSGNMTLSPSPSSSSNNHSSNHGGFFSKLKSKLQRHTSPRNIK